MADFFAKGKNPINGYAEPKSEIELDYDNIALASGSAPYEYTPQKSGWMVVSSSAYTSWAYVIEKATNTALALCSNGNANIGCFFGVLVSKGRTYKVMTGTTATITIKLIPFKD